MEERGLRDSGDCSDADEALSALSLSDLPLAGEVALEEREGAGAEEFEFAVRGGLISEEMCAAEDVFYQGRILPLRPSDAGKGSGSSSESMDLSSSSSSSGFNSSRSSTSSSRSSSCSEGRLSSAFYAHPSPKPLLGGRTRSAGRCRSGRKSSGWEVLRLGLVKPPEIELHHLRRQWRTLQKTPSEPEQQQKKHNFSMSCRCSSAVDTVPSQNLVIKPRIRRYPEEGEYQKLIQKKEAARRRTFEWLKQLSMAEAPHL